MIKKKAGSLKHNLNKISEVIEWIISLLEISMENSLLYEKISKLGGKVDRCYKKAEQIHEKAGNLVEEKKSLEQQMDFVKEEQFCRGHLDPDPGIKNGWDTLIEMAECDSYTREDVEEFLEERGVGTRAAKGITYLMHLIDYERFKGLEKEGKPLSELNGLTEFNPQDYK